MDAVGLTLGRPEREHHVVGEDQRDHDRGVPEPAVDVLGEQREPRLTGVLAVRLGDRAGRRREPERPVVGLAVVVAGQPEAEREDQDQQGRRERPPTERLSEVRRARDALVAQARRVERREVRLREVVLAGERPPRRVDDEGDEHHERRRRVEPPSVGTKSLRVDPSPRGPVHTRQICRHPQPPVVVVIGESAHSGPDVKGPTPTYRERVLVGGSGTGSSDIHPQAAVRTRRPVSVRPCGSPS